MPLPPIYTIDLTPRILDKIDKWDYVLRDEYVPFEQLFTEIEDRNKCRDILCYILNYVWNKGEGRSLCSYINSLENLWVHPPMPSLDDQDLTYLNDVFYNRMHLAIMAYLGEERYTQIETYFVPIDHAKTLQEELNNLEIYRRRRNEGQLWQVLAHYFGLREFPLVNIKLTTSINLSKDIGELIDGDKIE